MQAHPSRPDGSVVTIEIADSPGEPGYELGFSQVLGDALTIGNGPVLPRLEGPLPLSQGEARHARYARRLFVSDTVIVCGSVAAGSVAAGSLAWPEPTNTGHSVAAAALAGFWVLALSLGGSRSRRVAGRGRNEYASILLATMQLFGLIAMGSILSGIDISHAFLAVSLPLGVAGLMINRRFWRHTAAARRRNGHDQTSVLVVGSRQVARAIATTFVKDPQAGYRVAGLCLPRGPKAPLDSILVAGREIPVVGIDEAVVDAVRQTGVSAVALAATDHLQPTEIRRLIWELESLGVDLIVTPGLVDVADQRLHSRTVAGMAMLEVTKPQYSRANTLAKSTFDTLFALMALAVASPIMVIAAIAVKLSSPGPVFYPSERIGRDGTTFRMFKFRSMYRDADQHMPQMITADGGNPLFFKVKDDPRVTPTGRILRKFSIDELPQFFNVLRGEMSVVGPRPQVRREADSYDDLFRRRLSVKPGVTGLWQVSGRSDLHVEDAVRLDLSYVENWSLLQDLAIIARTVTTVLRGKGAY